MDVLDDKKMSRVLLDLVYVWRNLTVYVLHELLTCKPPLVQTNKPGNNM